MEQAKRVGLLTIGIICILGVSLAQAISYEFVTTTADPGPPATLTILVGLKNGVSTASPVVLGEHDLTSFTASWVNDSGSQPESFFVPDIFGPAPTHQLSLFIYDETLFPGMGFSVLFSPLGPTTDPKLWGLTLDDSGFQFFRGNDPDERLSANLPEVTKFGHTVPEPSTLLLIGTGLAGILAWRLKAGKKN